MSRGQPRDTGFPAALCGDLPESRGPEGRALCPHSWPPVTIVWPPLHCKLCPVSTGPMQAIWQTWGNFCATQSFWVKL